MSGALALRIATPASVLVEAGDVVSLRAEDASGSFGIQPGHVDMLTLLDASVVRWRTADAAMHYCAVVGGVLSVSDGRRIALACREAVLGDSLEGASGLQAQVQSWRLRAEDADKQARVEALRLHARAVRQMMSLLYPSHVPRGVLSARSAEEAS